MVVHGVRQDKEPLWHFAVGETPASPGLLPQPKLLGLQRCVPEGGDDDELVAVPLAGRGRRDLARDGREHAIRLLDGYADIKAADVQALDVRWTPQLPIVAGQDNGNNA
jgi:inorganic pyrophosphatase